MEWTDKLPDVPMSVESGRNDGGEIKNLGMATVGDIVTIIGGIEMMILGEVVVTNEVGMRTLGLRLPRGVMVIGAEIVVETELRIMPK